MTIKLGDWYFDSSEYDEEHDVLYLSIGRPRPGYGEETPEGHILRFDEEGEFCGVTLVDVQGLLQEGGYIDVSVPPKTSPRREWVAGADIRKALA